MTKSIIVPGTWAFTDEKRPYYGEDGMFVDFLRAHDYEPVGVGKTYWTTNADGTLIQRIISRQTTKQGWHRDWKTGGECLGHFLETIDNPERLVVFCHSHGLQVALYALSAPTTPAIGALCSIGSPDRADMEGVMVKAKRKIGKWLHMQMGGRDRWKWLGTIGTGSWKDTLGSAIGATKGPNYADRRDQLLELDHSEVLNDPNTFGAWTDTIPPWTESRLEWLKP